MILIASPCGYIINRNFIECREDAQHYLQRRGHQVITKLYQGVSISQNRNIAILEAFRLQAEWLIFIDTDMEFDGKDIEALMNHGGDVVTGVCKTGDKEYALYEYDNKTNGIRNINPKRIVDICGGAFLGIRRNIIRILCDPDARDRLWLNTRVRENTLDLPFNLVTAMNGVQFGEDVSFCLRLREIEVPINVSLGTRIGHEKIICIK